MSQNSSFFSFDVISVCGVRGVAQEEIFTIYRFVIHFVFLYGFFFVVVVVAVDRFTRRTYSLVMQIAFGGQTRLLN